MEDSIDNMLRELKREGDPRSDPIKKEFDMIARYADPKSKVPIPNYEPKTGFLKSLKNFYHNLF